MPSRFRSTIVVACVAASVPTACQLVAGLRAPDGGADLVSDASATDVQTVEAATGLPFACRPQLPGKPPRAADPGGLSFELVFSYFTHLTIPQVDAGEELCPTSGFRLDDQPCDAGMETADGSACRTSCRATTGDAAVDDAGTGDSGVDNAGGELVAKVESELVLTGTATNPTTGLERGGPNIMLRVDRYNGMPDDEDVGVEFLSLSGVSVDTVPFPDAALPGDAGVDAAGWAQVWDRRSLREWDVDPQTFVDGGLVLPKSRADAYVANNVLVVRVGTLPTVFAGIPFNVEHATFSGELRQTARGWTLVRGRLGGDVPLDELQRATQRFAGLDSRFCDALPTVVSELPVCTSNDRGHGGNCDALSIGASFTMVAGQTGKLRATTIPTPCPRQVCP